MEIAQEVTVFGASDVEASYLALANLKLTTRQVATAVRQGNCGSANELMATAWQQFIAYAPIASRTGQTSTVTSQAKNLALWDAKIGRMCSSPAATGPGMLGAFDIHDPSTKKKKLLIGGGIAAALVVIAMLKK